MKSLAIEREFGSGGREIGMKVAQAAGIPCYDGNLLLEAAKEQGISPDLLKQYDEKRSGSLLYDIAAFTDFSARSGGKNNVYELFYAIQKTIEKLELQGPSVFIGRACTEALKKNGRAVRVFIYSSEPQKRIERILRTERVATETEAKRLMDRKDRERRNSFKFWTQKDWGDRSNYDMELNTAMLSPDECAEILLSAIGR